MKTKVIYIFTGPDGETTETQAASNDTNPQIGETVVLTEPKTLQQKTYFLLNIESESIGGVLHKKCYLVDNALDEQFNLTQILSPKMGEDIQAQMKFVDKHTPPNLEPPPIDPVAAQSMSLQDLIRPVEPPHFVPKDKDWAKLEKQGWLFPDDYKRFIESYGGGYFGVFGLSIWSPFAKHPHFNLLKQFEDTEKELSDVARDWDRTCFKIFPEDEGRFWFGYKDGTYLCWTCSGKPADWKVAVDGVCEDDFHSFEIGFEELMTGLLSTPSFADKHLCDLVGSRTYQVTN